jgi:hypothetical protein
MRAKRSLRRAADLLSVVGVPVAEAAKVLARDPNSPVTQAIKLWGDDEEPFKNLITSPASAAREWRKTMARIGPFFEVGIFAVWRSAPSSCFPS